MQLLFIPVVLAVAGFWFNHRERKATELRAENEQKAAKFRAWNEQKAAEFRAEAEREIERQHAQTERDIAEDNQREAVLQEYINKISELLLHENLRKSEPEDEVRKIARVKTLTVLRRLDAERKGSVLQFLYEAGLISGDKDQVVIHLQEADLNGANLTRIFLNGVNLSRVNLNEAMLYRAILTNAILEFANLQRANI